MVIRSWLSPSFICSLIMAGWLTGCALPFFRLEVYTITVTIILLALIILQRSTVIRFICLLVVSYLIGSVYYNILLNSLINRLPAQSSGVYPLTVLENPDIFDDQLRYIARLPNKSTIYVTVKRQQPLQLGYTYTAKGTIKPTDKFHHWRQGIIGKMSQPTIEKIEPAKLSLWDKILLTSRRYFEQTIQTYFPEPDGSLYAGIVAGIRSGIPDSIASQFSTAGLSHIIAVSGFNVTVLVTLITRFTKQFGRIANCLTAILTILSFVIFAGGSASVVRAGILASLFIVARTMGRIGSIHRLLLFVAWGMSISNPLIVRYDIGFQLSFLAVLGLTLYCDKIIAILVRLRIPEWLAESVAATAAAQITTLPIILYYFGNLSPYSVLANIFVEPFIPIVTLSGPFFIAISLITKSILVYIALIIDLILKYILAISHFASLLPGSQSILTDLKIYIYPLYYLIILTPLYQKKRGHIYD